MEKLNINNINYNNEDENNDSLCVHIFNEDYNDYQTKIFKQNNLSETAKFYNSFVYDIQNDKFYYDNSPNVNKTDSLKLNLCDLTNNNDISYNIQLNKTNSDTSYIFDIYLIVNDTNKEIDLTKFNFDLVNNGKVNIKLIKQTECEYKEINEKGYKLIFNKNYEYINTTNIDVEIKINEKQKIKENKVQEIEELNDSFINFDVIFKDTNVNKINKNINSEISIQYSNDEIYHLENFLEQNKKYKKLDYIVKLDHNFVYKNINEFKTFIKNNQNKQDTINQNNKHIEKIEKQIASNEQINNTIKQFPNGCIIKWIGNSNEYKTNSICNFNTLAERYANKKYDIEDIMKIIVCKDEDVKRVYATALWKRGLEIESNKTKSKNEIKAIDNTTTKVEDIPTPIVDNKPSAITNENEIINNINTDSNSTKKITSRAIIKNRMKDNKKRNKKYKELIKFSKEMAENYKKIVNNCEEIIEENENILKNLNDVLEQTELFELPCLKPANFSITV